MGVAGTPSFPYLYKRRLKSVWAVIFIRYFKIKLKRNKEKRKEKKNAKSLVVHQSKIVISGSYFLINLSVSHRPTPSSFPSPSATHAWSTLFFHDSSFHHDWPFQLSLFVFLTFSYLTNFSFCFPAEWKLGIPVLRKNRFPELIFLAFRFRPLERRSPQNLIIITFFCNYIL